MRNTVFVVRSGNEIIMKIGIQNISRNGHFVILDVRKDDKDRNLPMDL